MEFLITTLERSRVSPLSDVWDSRGDSRGTLGESVDGTVMIKYVY